MGLCSPVLKRTATAEHSRIDVLSEFRQLLNPSRQTMTQHQNLFDQQIAATRAFCGYLRSDPLSLSLCSQRFVEVTSAQITTRISPG